MHPFDQLCSWPNLLAAWPAAARGKRGHANVAAFEYRLEENLLALQAALREIVHRAASKRRRRKPITVGTFF